MTRHLLDLPEEILDECLEELLPPLRPHNGPISLRDLKCTPDPIDLCRVMLTCKTLHNLAYPWVWRRVHVDGRRGRCTYLCNHPEAAAHVRIFIIDWDSETGPPYLSRIGLAAFRPAIRLMDNLGVLSIRVWGPDPCLSEVLEELIAKPRLHTLLSFQPPGMSCVVSPLNVQRLCYSGKYEGFSHWDLPAMPRLKSLALVNSGAIRRTLSIPWERLSDLEIAGIDSWRSVLYNFSASILVAPMETY